MLGLYSMLNLGARALQANQTGSEVTGHNIANANNPAYSRQRVDLTTSTPVSTGAGEEGTGVEVAGIDQVRDSLLDGQIQVENSVSASLTQQQSALQQAETALGQSLDSSKSASGSSGATTDATGSQSGIGDAVNGLFTEFQNLANDPSSLTERNVLLMKASDMTSRFNQVSSRLSGVQNSLNSTVSSDVTQVNQLLSDIAGLNHQIGAAALNGSTANDLNDSRQAKIEKLAGLLNVDVATSSNNEVNISVQGSSLVSGDQVADTLQTYADANGQLQLQTVSSSTAITPTGGSIQGAMEVRDGALKNLQDGVNSLASNLITEVNAVHSSGYSLTGASGAPFFTGASAADIAVNSDLSNNPALVQASGDASSTSDNQTALAMAQLGSKAVSGLNGQTFTGQYSGVVTALGQAASTVNSQAADQTVVQNMLTQQRNSTSGVSMDEEMTNMMTYQHAYEASAKIVSTVDSMLSTLIDMKQNP